MARMRFRASLEGRTNGGCACVCQRRHVKWSFLFSLSLSLSSRMYRNHNNGLNTVSSSGLVGANNHHVLTPVPGDPSGRLVMTLLPSQGQQHELMHHHASLQHPHHHEQHHSGASHSSGSTRYQGNLWLHCSSQKRIGCGDCDSCFFSLLPLLLKKNYKEKKKVTKWNRFLSPSSFFCNPNL